MKVYMTVHPMQTVWKLETRLHAFANRDFSMFQPIQSTDRAEVA